MLNIAFVFRDATKAIKEFGDHLEVPSVVAAVFMMQRDVINHYRYSMEHYFTISLNEAYLQNSSLGTPYQKWAHVVNGNHELLSLMIRQLLRYTSRLVHETDCKQKRENHDFSDAKNLSNSYTSPISEIKYHNKPIGIHVHEDKKLTVTWIRNEPRPERVISRGRADQPMKYYLIESDLDGHEIERPISKEEYMHYTESVSQTVYEIGNRKILDAIKFNGMSEILELEDLNDRFREVAEEYLRGRKICLPHTNLNESYWI